MNKISSSLVDIKEHYTVVVIGSGYGGGISASRMARAGQSVCVLERGKEFMPGEFPDTLTEAGSNVQVDTPSKHIGSHDSLFDLRVNDDINVLQGCGLGGTSLINANVVIEADPRVFEHHAWPVGMKDSINSDIKVGYKHAREMLKPSPYPDNNGYPKLKKLEAMKQSAKAMKQEFYRPDIAVNFKEHSDGHNHVGVPQTPCINCGDCCSGCNHTSKNTVQMTYLPDAWNHDAEIFTEASVRYVENQAGKWLVHYQPVDVGRDKFDAPNLFVSADIVILAAGTLGSTEILLRSKENGLKLSDKLGHGFSGNGDVFGFAYNNDQEINGIGWGTREPDAKNPIGPTITGIIDTRPQAKDFRDGMTIEEGALPGALSPMLPATFSALSSAEGIDTDKGVADYLREKKREIVSLLRGSYHGAVDNTQMFLVMTHDSSSGIMTLQNDRLRISWPNVGKEPIFTKVQKALIQATKALGGIFVRNPIWSKLFGHDLISVHPLGGCNMAEDVFGGVVNHEGQVFSTEGGENSLHDGLFVMDGAVIPAAVGTNPLLTISAIAERNIARLAKKRGWDINYQLPSAPSRTVEPDKPGIRFTETMEGYFSSEQNATYEEGAKHNKRDNPNFKFTLTISSDDIEAMLKEEKHQAKMFGTVDAKAISDESLTVHDGVFNLFVKDPNVVNGKRMWYRMGLKTQDGKDFYFVGYKLIKDDPGMDVWSDTTTLYITVHDGSDSNAPIFGRGILIIAPTDFAKQMTTMAVTNVSSAKDRLKYSADFGKLFAGALYHTYGGVFAGLNYFDVDAPQRKYRPLRVEAPEVFPIETADGVFIRLTRYQGGSKGPVILSHGLGVSSKIFSTDTVDTNLLEYLYAHEYDVWLLDYRASIDLPAANDQFTGDDIAQYDYPAAVDFVRKITGSESVQMVVHCFGSTTWTMSMLGGWLNGVRSAVCSQVSIDMVVPTSTKLKSGLHVPTMLDKVGIDSLTAYVEADSGWQDKLFDKILRLYPIQAEERCDNPVCHRITFLYSQLYEHDQLNDLIHQNLHELFGLANITAFEHLAGMARKGHIVNFAGEDVYTPHLERMAIPITFISGEENDCFLPESTTLTVDRLVAANGAALYSRKTIPGYGHIDCIFGKNAVVDVYEHILKQLEDTPA